MKRVLLALVLFGPGCGSDSSQAEAAPSPERTESPEATQGGEGAPVARPMGDSVLMAEATDEEYEESEEQDVSDETEMLLDRQESLDDTLSTRLDQRRCVDASTLRDQICGLADRICEISRRHPESDDARDHCEDGRERCEDAITDLQEHCGD